MKRIIVGIQSVNVSEGDEFAMIFQVRKVSMRTRAIVVVLMS